MALTPVAGETVRSWVPPPDVSGLCGEYAMQSKGADAASTLGPEMDRKLYCTTVGDKRLRHWDGFPLDSGLSEPRCNCPARRWIRDSLSHAATVHSLHAVTPSLSKPKSRVSHHH
ncbi:hypothetical protein SISSUDRAFT_1049378 [Sistotremastrum suecicum HHB10207 ss-3]|uniref:Uncharacterized protein n=1 Tax=Sistotremastrum suecicum HHB10207 ss-3 TaxID=1314776 RepID=A0A166BX72_9AGAM|nr:hypothetical protein SISSUDRAFT_1049378 [Sistotremastrum suecicum HHB10207 ss-3]